ncbi:MAG: SDR family oxidoreductase, partial [Chloroflexi bacterium]|nr:SDR family oxidoreductase [Chloroflexota bacterium]
AIVTGAARGLGLDIARRLLRDGMAVTMADVDEAVHAEAAQLGDHAHAVVCDVRDSWHVDSLVETTIVRSGRLDLFVANAGVGGGRPIVEMSDEVYRQIVSVNLDGTFYSCRAAARAMIPAGVGSIVTIGSIFGRDTPAGSGVYGATKAGIVAMTHALARELGPHGIRVNCVSPGNMATEMHWAALRRQAAARSMPFERVVDEVRANIPLGRHGTGDDVAAMVSFLASNDAAYVTGQTINVDGGYQPI